MKRTLKRPALTIAASALGFGLVLSGCGGTDTPDDVEGQTGDPNVDAPTSDAPDQRPTTSTEDSGGETEGSGQGIGNIDVVETAIATAEGEGGTAMSIDSDDNGTWEVTTLDGETKFEYSVSADGSSIEATEEDSADTEDTEELGAADISLLEAINAVGEAHQGDLDDAELDTENGEVRYEISLQGERMDYLVDPSTGEVTEDSR
ncbi:PepSY domain-containing protein [Brevibacterium pityocampae]|uniref:PepSY domain-containing protein n=1 Tax=Brevibacterium pityocampae TaxID=506594 RepID=A0ABP8J7Z3_9MICO